MRCRNCGADLKPGINYCLECGSFLDEEDDDKNNESSGDIINNNTPIDFGPQKKVIRKKKRRRKMSTMDLLIYLGLGLVFVVSIIVIIVALVKGKEDQVYIPPEADNATKKTIKTVAVDDYKVKIDGNLSYEVQGSIIYVSDNDNYTFTYRNVIDDYDKYAKDLTLLSNDLEESNYQLLDSDKLTVDSHEFIVYEIIASSRTKYLYLTKVNKNYLSMGIIESLDNGDWKQSLSTIAKMNDDIEFDAVSIEKEETTAEVSKIIDSE